MAKFVKSNRPANVSANVSANVVADMPTGLGAMPTNLGAMPAAPMPAAAPRLSQGASAKSAVANASAPQSAEELSKLYMEGVNKIINVEVAKLLEKINEISGKIAGMNDKIVAMDEHINALDMFVKDIEPRVKDIEDYLSSSDTDECSTDDIGTTFVADECSSDDIAADECEDECEDELTPDDIDPDKVLQYLRKEPNVSVNVIRSVRNALGRKQFAISSIKNDEEAFCECLEALDSMGIDLEQFVK